MRWNIHQNRGVQSMPHPVRALVKSWRTPRAVLGMWAALLLSGCAVRAQGLITPTARGARIETLSGRSYPLRLNGEARMLAHLDSHTVRIEGVRLFGRVWLSRWSVPEGLHGMTAWIGALRMHGLQLGIDDHNSGTFLVLDRDAVAVLAPYAGRPVLLEGYVEGAHIIRVLYYRVLDEASERQRAR